MKRVPVYCLALVTLVAIAPVARATTVTFDDLNSSNTSNNAIPNYYGGIIWGTNQWYWAPSGDYYQAVSAPNYAYVPLHSGITPRRSPFPAGGAKGGILLRRNRRAVLVRHFYRVRALFRWHAGGSLRPLFYRTDADLGKLGIHRIHRYGRGTVLQQRRRRQYHPDPGRFLGHGQLDVRAPAGAGSTARHRLGLSRGDQEEAKVA